MSSIIKYFKSSEGVADLPIRLGLGAVFVAHGGQKLFGWFGGYGLEGTAQWMDSIGLSPGMFMAVSAGGMEFFGGLFLLAGLLTRLAAIGAAVTMLVAIVAVHLSNGFFMANNGYEYGLVLLLMGVSLAIRGSGTISLDNALFGRA